MKLQEACEKLNKLAGNRTIKRLEKLKRRVISANILPLQKLLEVQARHILKNTLN